jgi:hypothetical protein
MDLPSVRDVQDLNIYSTLSTVMIVHIYLGVTGFATNHTVSSTSNIPKKSMKKRLLK